MSTTTDVKRMAPETKLHMDNLKALVAVIWVTFVVCALLVAFSIYTAYTYTVFRDPSSGTPVPPGSQDNWKWAPFSTIVFASLSGLFIIVMVALTGKKRYIATEKGVGIPTQIRSIGGTPQQYSINPIDSTTPSSVSLETVQTPTPSPYISPYTSSGENQQKTPPYKTIGTSK